MPIRLFDICQGRLGNNWTGKGDVMNMSNRGRL